MTNIYSASKSAGQEDKSMERPRLQPLRMHELLGLPKSTGKKDSVFGTLMDKPMSQPIRMKDLLGSTDGKKSMKPTSGKKLSDFPHLVGRSKSDVKINKTAGLGRERMQPERLKDFLESWETSQTVQPSASKPITIEPRNANVRRKLWSVSHASPATIPSNNRKSIAPLNPKARRTLSVDAKPLKPDNRKSVKPEISKASRKSCLLPPNSIRDKYVSNKQNDTIREESPLGFTLENKSRLEDSEENEEKNDAPNGNILCERRKSTVCDNCVQDANKKWKTSKNDKSSHSLALENLPADTKKPVEDEEERTKNEIPRPTVIMGLSSKKIEKENECKAIESEKKSAQNSRSPLQELIENSPAQRFNATNTSFEDLHGNTLRRDRGESLYYENLPRDSFLECTGPMKNSFVNVDRQTLAWMHGNLKLNIQSSEEQLFSMRILLKTLEDLMKNEDNSGSRVFKTKIEADDVSTEMNDDSKKNHDTETPVPQENDREIETNLPETRVDEAETPNSMNQEENSNSENLIDQDKENRGNCDSQTRRRSARLARKMSKSPKRSDDSFSRIEKELNIVHMKTKKDTPVNMKSGKRFDPRSRRSIREYMALKSTINFLDTPDIKGFATPMGEKDTPSHSRITRRSLSRKLLTELDDLYAESPI